MAHQMYKHRVQTQRETTEFEHLTERIRHLKLQVCSKHRQLKQCQAGMSDTIPEERSSPSVLQPVL